MDAVFATFADFAIQTFSSTRSYSSAGSVAPSSTMNAPIFGSTAQG